MNYEQKEKISTNHYECPNCGGIPTYDHKSQNLKCPYCFTIVEIDKTITVCEQDIDELLANTTIWKNTEVIECHNCGSKEVVSEGELSTSCSFCGTTNIVKTSEIIGMKPHGICTFEKDINTAKSLVAEWIKKQKFTPNNFKKTATIQSLRGIYSPAFTFDCKTNTTYDGRLGITRSRSTTDSQGNRRSESYTSYFTISGTYNRDFDDLIIHTSSNIPSHRLEDLEPFPTTTCKKYNEKYLTGYSANTYSKDGKSTWEDFQNRSSKILKKEILSKYRYDKVSYFNSKTNYSNTKFKYLLLPVYVGHHTYNKKNYNFYVNGCTGKISGKAPKSFWKILFFILGVVGAITLPIILSILMTMK